ncbi:MAG: c-type cytochrome [Rhizobiales bacterium]|nr:c-type cytochrome [Hyphomicrobiales bacterium]
MNFAVAPLAALALCAFAQLAVAQAPPASTPAADQSAAAAPDGKALFRTKTCIACHGRDGAKAIQNYPNLAGQDAKYMIAQMEDIASGARVSGPDPRGYPRTQGMKDVMHLVSKEERETIAHYLAALPAPKPAALDPPPAAERLAQGKAAYTKGGCQTCHGADGLKPLPLHPALAGMKRDYLVAQMKDMREGVRANGKSKTMLPFVKKLDDANVELIADYLSQIERPAR